MKKIIFILSISLIIISSCDKKSDTIDNSTVNFGEVSQEEYAYKSGIGWSVIFSAGHHERWPSCCGFTVVNGIGTPIPHIPCYGSGSLCSHTISIMIDLKKSGITLNEYYNSTVTFLYEDFKDEFRISSKSIEVLDGEDVRYINIPDQVMLQKVGSDSFIATNVSFT